MPPPDTLQGLAAFLFPSRLSGRFLGADSALGEGRRFFRGGGFALPFLEFEADLVFIDFEKCGKWPAFLGDESMDEVSFA